MLRFIGACLQALAVVKHLLRGHKSDADVLKDLAELLAQPAEEHAEVLRHEKCTGASPSSPSGMLCPTICDVIADKGCSGCLLAEAYIHCNQFLRKLMHSQREGYPAGAH